MAETRRSRLVRFYIAAQVGIPTFVYAVRLVTGEKLTPWGWQMFS